MKKTKFLILVTFTVIASCIAFKKNNITNDIIVGSYNVRYAAPADEQTGNGWHKRKTHVMKIFTDYALEIVGTQEANDMQLDEMKKVLNHYDVVAHHYGGKSGKNHNAAIFFNKERFELMEKGVFWLSETPDVLSVGWDATDPRICQWVRLLDKRTKKTFFVFNSHFYYRYKTARQNSGKLIVDKISSIAKDQPVILMGDLNSTENTPQIKKIKSLLHDVAYVETDSSLRYQATGFSGGVFQGAPNNRIDYIFVSSHFIPLNYKVIKDQYDGDRYPSDHLPIISKIQFN